MATALLVLSSIVVGGAWPLAMEQFSVRPNAADVERQYIERNIAATRQAYRIDQEMVEYRDYPGVGTKSPRDVPADVTTIANARLLDPNVLSRTFTQQQQLKNFYSFPGVLDIDRYQIDGELSDYIVGARELSPDSLTGNQTDWINRHTVYTHGNGFVAAPANRVNAAVRDAANTSDSNSGYPIYTVSDIASHKSDRQIIPVEQPRIYYGEVIAQADPDYAIVGGPPGSAPREYDTDTSKYTYTGRGGVSIGNWFNRALFATRFVERNILFSRAIGSESKMILYRDPKDRVQKVAPWLTTDTNAYPAVVAGRIVWIIDAYTTLDTYPYAQRSALGSPSVTASGVTRSASEVSYVRNSVKATVDAYDGTVTLYQVDRQDPVLQTWMRIFPGSVKSEDEIPDELRAHFRYPEDLFKVQRELLAKYHVDEPREFFTTNAFWSVPSDPTDDTIPEQPPFYVLVGDQQTAAPSFRLASAMVGFNREFLSSYISANSDPDDYGKITVLRLPTDTLTQGPQQIQNSMISDTRVASERTLLERSNRIHYGNLLTLPIADGGVLYVEPLYTERISTSPNSSTFPQLSRVLASFREPGGGGVKVGYAPTLAEALDQLFGPGAGQAAQRQAVTPSRHLLRRPPHPDPRPPRPPGQRLMPNSKERSLRCGQHSTASSDWSTRRRAPAPRPGVSGCPSAGQVVGTARRKPRPLRGRASVGPELIAAGRVDRLRPALRRLLPCLLPAVHGEVEKLVAGATDLGAATRRPIRLEDPVTVAQIAAVPAGLAPRHQVVARVAHRIPRHLPAHEVAIPRALVVRAFAERRIRDVAAVQIRQFAGVPGEERAALALVLRGLAVVPHVEVHEELSTPLEHVYQRHRTVRSDHRHAGVHLDHRQRPPCSGDRVTLAQVGLLPHQQLVHFVLPVRPVNGLG